MPLILNYVIMTPPKWVRGETKTNDHSESKDRKSKKSSDWKRQCLLIAFLIVALRITKSERPTLRRIGPSSLMAVQIQVEQPSRFYTGSLSEERAID